MQLDVLGSLWSLREIERSRWAGCLRAAGCCGVEGRLPADAASRRAWRDWLEDQGFDYIAVLFSGGDVLPPPGWTPQQHLLHLQQQVDAALALQPRLLNVLAGSDRWPLAQQVDFLGRAVELALDAGVPWAFETHRGSSLYSPWISLELIRQLPDLLLTLDVSHWVVVAERLLDDAADAQALQPLIGRVRHIQARVGYAQGPQVPHPAAPEYRQELQWHQALWRQVWQFQREAGDTRSTLTPEFGPDGYLQQQPFGGPPVAELWGLNHWMALEQRRQHVRWLSTACCPQTTGVES
jgi:hypothetical protein